VGPPAAADTITVARVGGPDSPIATRAAEHVESRESNTANRLRTASELPAWLADYWRPAPRTSSPWCHIAIYQDFFW